MADGHLTPNQTSGPTRKRSSGRPSPYCRPWTRTWGLYSLGKSNESVKTLEQAITVAVFKAALTVVRDGRDQPQNIKDPSGNGPFEYRARDNGFDLKSKLLFNS